MESAENEMRKMKREEKKYPPRRGACEARTYTHVHACETDAHVRTERGAELTNTRPTERANRFASRATSATTATICYSGM